MEVLQRAINEGIQFEVNGDRLKIKSTKPIPPDLVEQLRVHKQEIIRTLKEQGEADSYSEYQDKGQGKENDSEASGKARRWCTGYKPPLSREDRERWMDAYLDEAIGRLNARGAVYYKPDDPRGQREEIYRLERQITETFLVCNVSAFVEAVDRWQKTFFKQGGKAR